MGIRRWGWVTPDSGFLLLVLEMGGRGSSPIFAVGSIASILANLPFRHLLSFTAPWRSGCLDVWISGTWELEIDCRESWRRGVLYISLCMRTNRRGARRRESVRACVSHRLGVRKQEHPHSFHARLAKPMIMTIVKTILDCQLERLSSSPRGSRLRRSRHKTEEKR